MAELDNFVGREVERKEFGKLLEYPKGNTRIFLMLGPGGIGKTLLEKKMLEEAGKKAGLLAPKEPIDFFHTDYQYIDGIQKKIKEVIESLVGQAGEQGPFAEFIKRSTSKQFHACMQRFCAEHPLVLAFDTFEYLDKVASDWLFEDDEEGLQVPGLICIIATRIKEKADIEKYRTNPLVKEILISGFTLGEAQEFYQRIANEFNKTDLLKDLLKAEGIGDEGTEQKAVEWIWEITEGRPLTLEMVFRWSGTLLRQDSLSSLTTKKFEEQLMRHVLELGERDLLDVGPLKVSKPVFDTVACMAYITRRFDEEFLQFLIDKQFIRLDRGTANIEDILGHLKKYFFVKERTDSGKQAVIQLHDEMVRLLKEYVWSSLDISGERKQRLFGIVIEFYKQSIFRASSDNSSDDFRDTLRIEQLYYMLQYDRDAGRRLWMELVEFNSKNINKLLPGEIESYIEDFDNPEAQYEINRRIGELEGQAGHVNHANKYWENVRELGEKEKRDDWVVSALIGMFNCSMQGDVDKALENYLIPARTICEKNVPTMRSDVYYEFGFAHRKLHDINQALHYYQEAKVCYQNFPDIKDDFKYAVILNDMGYAYSFVGDWNECNKNVKEAFAIRQKLFDKRTEGYEQAKAKLAEATTDAERALLNEELYHKQANLEEAKLHLGLSHNTLGEIFRHQGELSEALEHYNESYSLFKQVRNYYWQARALNSRGETYRRLAKDFKVVDKQKYRELIEKAQKDSGDSLYLCEKYQLVDEHDTAYRRMGRVLHDRALDFMIEGDKSSACDFLNQARSHFQQGLDYARRTKNVLEELENLVELAFLLHDAIDAFDAENVPLEYRQALTDLGEGIKKHKKDNPRIVQFRVLESLYKLERGATYHAEERYTESLKEYLQGYKGLGLQPGYGHARYRQHFSQLMRKIENLPDDDAKEEWCKRFIQLWEDTKIPKTRGRTLAQEMTPDLVVECNKVLNSIARRKE